MRSIPLGWFLLSIILSIVLCIILTLQVLDDQKLDRIEDILDTPPPVEVPTPSPTNPHRKAIDLLEADAGVPLSRIAMLEIRSEGKRTRPYPDGNGNATIGVGRNLRGNGVSVAELHAITNEIDYRYLMTHAHIQNGRVRIPTLDLATRIFTKPLTENDIQLLLTDDLKNVAKEAQQVFGTDWQKIDEVRKEVIVDTLFNLGLTRFKKFVKFIDAVKQGNWDTASVELLQSDAAHENVVRYHRNATVLRTGDAKYFGL